MRTAVYSTDSLIRPGSVRRSVGDVAILLRFRLATARRGSTIAVAALFLTLTLASAVVPAFADGAGTNDRAFNLLLLLPTAMAGLLALAVVSAVASGGGRELLPRDPAQVFPVSPTTDHLGALLLTPLNIAWLIQSWILLGSGAYAVGHHSPLTLMGLQLGLALWLAFSTALAQAAAWTIEGIRRTAHGVPLVRALTVLVLATAVALQLTNTLVEALDNAPTSRLFIGFLTAPGPRWWVTILVLLLAVAVTVAAGAVPAHWAAHRLPRDEVDIETGHQRPRPTASSPLVMLVRTDRASVWRAVPMRRGLAVLAVGPGLVAVLGDLPWSSMTILPGLVVSGGALLFGVNAWCLDGRGGRWRESLPVDPSTVFAARAWVLTEFLLVASLVTVALGSLRAGAPSLSEFVALFSCVAVVLVQVVAASMRWSLQHPYAVDLRSARATPAPPLAMVGYSARLALSTTVAGLIFSGLARVPDWRVPVLLAVPLVAWSTARLLRARRVWLDPGERARVVLTVTA